MPDSKITALASTGTGTDPANDPLVIVDVSDTSMAASGTTKKVTLNNLLACSPTATLASATITGDLTVDTNVLKVDTTLNRVGIGTATPLNAGHIQGAGQATVTPTVTGDQSALSLIDSQTVANNGGMLVLGSICSNGNFGQVGIKSLLTNGLQNGTSALAFFTRAAVADTTLSERYRIAQDGVATWSNVGGVAGTAMTLNSTGLGVGISPSSGKIAARAGTSATGNSIYVDNLDGTYNPWFQIQHSSAGIKIFNSSSFGGASNNLIFGNGTTSETMRIDASGNVGIGVTPSAWGSGYKVIQGQIGGFALSNDNSSNNQFRLSSNAYFDTTDSRWEYYGSSTATAYEQRAGEHRFFNAVSGSANAAITFTQAMTLDASGNLLVGTTSNTNSSRVFVRGTGTNPSLAIQGATGDLAQPGLLVGKFDNDSTTSQILVRFTINNNAAGSGQINANGASQAAFGSFSDSRLKENIVSLPSQLANILSLRPVEFDYKDGSGHQIGFVAQEMQEVYSDAVGEQNGFLTVTGWSKTEARLVSAIKELAAKVQALEAKLA